jgi:TadE-like protein
LAVLRRGDGRRCCANERGAVLVEFALLLPLLVCLILGLVTGGDALARKNSMTNGVREAARLGATLPEGASWATWGTVVRDRVVELVGGDVTNSDVCVEMIQWHTSGGGTRLGGWPATGCTLSMTAPSVPANTPDGQCVVKVWATDDARLEVLFFTQSLTLEAKAVGRYERTECP